MKNKKQIHLDAEYNVEVSRLFIFRFLWAGVVVFPLIPLAIWGGMVNVLQVIYMLIFGKRQEGLWNYKLRFFRFLVSWESYFQLLVDERPSFWW